MEIRLSCNEFLVLNGFYKLELIKLDILSYDLINDTLKGDVKISGTYKRVDDENGMGFEEIVPFTIVFRNNKIKINNIYIENDEYNINNNTGVNVKFDIVVNYDIFEENDKKECDDIIEIPVEVEEEQQVSSINIKEEFDELVLEAEQITKQYDNILDNFMNIENRSIDNENDKKDDMFNFQTSSYKTITIFYLNNENEIEMISKERRIPIHELYKNNDDFTKTRRIIVNE